MSELVYKQTSKSPWVLEHWTKGMPLTYSKLTFNSEEAMLKHIEKDKEALSNNDAWQEKQDVRLNLTIRLTSLYWSESENKRYVSYSEYDNDGKLGFTYTGRSWNRLISDEELFILLFPNPKGSVVTDH